MSTGNLPRMVLPRTDEGIRICQVIKVKPEALEGYKKVLQGSISFCPSADSGYYRFMQTFGRRCSLP